ncbi:efflux RND transporter periplasmic adaptor subunit [Pseudoalteromonas umbrosa]|uniref:efflux RND transporter periplasmic adaptor subunit n=1 Tax=Pseudoalteromonas umbrosa TaxID=3048489 RepID=UPI0024C2B315|nr:HlyD family efflux transporter periplasmic adaptor subunit [Pseudoalteromonas sp. B95]MDK1288226.1 HlyD family efflux transporter periplasmic adaptor subunit [Pseudoalteromonas sp. B95]
MDFKIEKKSNIKSYLYKSIIFILIACVAFYLTSNLASGNSYSVSAERLSFSTVSEGVFKDVIPINGIVEPQKVVYIDAVQGGTVSEIFVNEGELVTVGQPLLKFQNTAFELDIFSQEARISEQLDINANTRLSLDRNELELKTKINDVDYQVKRLTRQLKLKKELRENKHIAEEELESIIDEYEHSVRYREILGKSQEQEMSIRETKIRQLKESEVRLNEHLKIIRESLGDLTVKAPFTGLLSSLDLDVGESKAKGDRLGQVDLVDGFRIAARVDSFYIARVEKGMSAFYADLDTGTEYELKVSKVYPEVRNGVFLVDLDFVDSAPSDIRRGQNLVLSLNLGASKKGHLIDNGAFYLDTGGEWVFVLDDSGTKAVKRKVSLGRRNLNHVEVLEGLGIGERIITSTYSNFLEKDLIQVK